MDRSYGRGRSWGQPEEVIAATTSTDSVELCASVRTLPLRHCALARFTPDTKAVHDIPASPCTNCSSRRSGPVIAAVLAVCYAGLDELGRDGIRLWWRPEADERHDGC